ncbi:3-deoxy-D-manno-octulosonate 8-phosphate phosphatase [Hymenobacter oligotrophus]|uniref:3-deoxy-D-manno-octulosonate 8-phosphate phosphatase n=1 Tax=Hymenobacter oligotrophus TaxID=2319843 RepID=A0A3B7R0F6_9BACT|nr:3-deoxy-D-manno-octulosonate 8-phosphate phosphatase [Hymenobacter oligotrophus]AYA38898.1 3-deoxy-D-manno-octulosonate 8-phosphate phosphatase [Hymenobacter oligotrophus]
MLDFSAVEAFVFDVDGVLTDGTLLALSTGEQVRSFHIRDGFAIRHALRQGYRVVIISGRQEEGVRKRLESLDVTEIYLGVDDKLKVFGACGLEPGRVAYMGDDVPDLEVMRRCHIAACPADAAADVIEISQYIAKLPGGHGAARELIENVMKAQGKW